MAKIEYTEGLVVIEKNSEEHTEAAVDLMAAFHYLLTFTLWFILHYVFRSYDAE